jgi:hypothetical protein
MAIQGGYDLKLVGLEAEATFGTDAAAGLVKWPGIVTSLPNITEDYAKTTVRGLGAGRDPGIFYRTKKEVALSLESYICTDDAATESIFGLALGTIPDGTTGIITNSDVLRSCSIETGFDDGAAPWYELFVGCTINSVGLQCTEGEVVTLNTDFFVKDVTRAATEVSRTADNVSNLVPHTVRPFTFEDVTVAIAGETAIVRTITVDIANNLNRIYGLNGTATIANNFATKRDVTGSFTIVKENNNLRDVFTADPFDDANSKTITVTLSKNSGTEYLRLTLTNCRLMSRSFDRPGDDVKELEETYDFVAETVEVKTKQ